MPKPTGTYYYANGQRVPLRRDRLQLAVNASFEPSTDASTWKQAIAHGRTLPGGVVLVRKSELSGTLLRNLDAAGAAHPVFADKSATLVVLPEVRVEASVSQQRSLKTLVERSRTPGTITDENEEMLVIRPKSGRGEDALRLANELGEAVPPPRMAQARFVRVISRPEPSRQDAPPSPIRKKAHSPVRKKTNSV